MNLCLHARRSLGNGIAGWAVLATLLFGCAVDGGPTGTGIAASIQGNVIEVSTGATAAEPARALPPVHLSIDEVPGIEATTDPDGSFALSGDFSGSITLRFTTEQFSASERLEVPAGSLIVLENVELRPQMIRVGTVRQLGFFGTVAFVDCEAGDLLINDRNPAGHQFLAHLPSEAVIVRGDGLALTCADILPGDPIAIEGTIRMGDRTIDAQTVTISPPAPGEPSPLVEVRFSGFVTLVNCESGMLLIEEQNGRSRIRLSEETELTDGEHNPIRCDDIPGGARVSGEGLIRARRPGVVDAVRMAVELADGESAGQLVTVKALMAMLYPQSEPTMTLASAALFR